MCGICGELIFSGRGQVQQRVLETMRDAMAHRGPDDAGVWLSRDGSVGLGHRRLSIVDLSPAGHQPMANEDGMVWIVYNGEIYNHLDIRRNLEKCGHTYRSRCDTETIVHAYEEYGQDCVEYLEGMFAFAIWDEKQQELFLARDRVGVKPLYYWRDNDRLVFASEIKAILRHPSVPKRPDVVALYHYLSLSASPMQQTLFSGVRKLEAGHTMTIARDGSTQEHCYWNPFNGPRLPATLSEPECAGELVYLLTKSIERRMMSDVPFGVFLSGGVDSSINVLLMSQCMDRPVDTFSVALADDVESDEFMWARRVAEHFHCNHHEVVVDDRQFLEFVERMAYYQDSPLADPVCVPLYYVSKLARDNGVIVVQVGEGSDEIFAGYNGYQAVLEREEWANQWQRWVPPALKDFAVRLAAVQGQDKAADFLRRLRDNERVFWGGAVAFYETEKRQMLSDAILAQTRDLSTWEIIRAFYEEAHKLNGELDPLQEITFIELKHRLPELLLMRVDKMSMATSIETRVPYLDHHLVEFAMHLPREMKIRNGVGKYLLKEAMRDRLPPGVVDRPKRGFCGAAPNMLRGPIMEKLIADLRSSPFLRDLLRPQAIELLLAPADHQANSFKLWNLWNLALWHKCWFE